jgi:hypothetical protein
MSNKTLATINLLCIAAPVSLGAIEGLIGKPVGNLMMVGIMGLFMIVFGIWISLRMYKLSDQ